jgi:hypothetical protein
LYILVDKHRNACKDSRSPGRELNSEPPEHEAEMLTVEPLRSFQLRNKDVKSRKEFGIETEEITNAETERNEDRETSESNGERSYEGPGS